MITATASLPTTTLTPVVDGAVTTTLTTATGVPSSEGFSNALTAQLNLLAQPATDAAALVTPSAILSAAMTASIATPAPIATELLTNSETTVSPTLQQTVTTTNASSISPLITANSSVTTGTTLSNAPTVSTAATMSAEDTAILSAVTGTLKFTTSGSKLGDTLPAGQSVQLPVSNPATELTQQSVQAVVTQAVTNTQVNTPANVLVQQITPVGVQTPATTTTQTGIVTTPQIPDNEVSTAQTVVTSQAQLVETPVANIQVQTPVANTQVQTPVANAQVQTPVANVQVQTPVANVQVQTPVANVQVQTPVANAQVQTPVANAQVQTTVANAQVQTPVANVQVQTPVANAQVQTPVANAQVQTPVANVQVQTPVANVQVQTPAVETSVTSQDQIQTNNTPQQTPITQTVVVTAQSELQQVPTTTPDSNQPIVTEQISQDDVVVQVQQNNTPKIPNQARVATDIVITPQLAVTAPLLPVGQGVSVKAKSGDSGTPVVTSDAEHKTVENQDTPVVQVVSDVIIASQVTAQAAPPVQTKTENVSVETASDTTTQDKPTLTSAKTLLMDAVANRNPSGDAANNSNNGNNAPSNPVLQGDALLNQQTDNKQGVDTKSFASVLNTENTDVLSASATAPTSDKSTPQGVTNAVNKLVQDTKVDVPAMTKPLSHPEWNQDLGERIVWMNNKGVSSAEIKMNPPNMGPISVRIDMNQDQATIAFTAQNSDVRNALEASVPRLREMLSSQHVNLAEVNVSQQSSTSTDSGRSQQQFAQMADTSTNSGQGGNRQNNPEVDAQGNPINVGNSVDGTVDEFANGQVISSNGTNGLLSIYA